MTELKRDWRKIKYYPVSMEKLEQASMKEAAYLIAPMNIGEDYEYFDKVKHLLIIPEPHKSIEELKQELDEKFEKLIEQYKRNSYASKLTTERNYDWNFDKIIGNFEYAKEHGRFKETYTLDFSKLIATGSNVVSFTTQYRVGDGEVGYWSIQPNIQVYLKKKPNMIVRFFTKFLLNFEWENRK